MDTGIGAGDGMGVEAGKAILGGGEVKVGKGVGISALGVNVGKGVIVSVEGGAMIVGVSVAGGVVPPQAVRRATKMIKMYRDLIVIGNLLC
jgi:hypothetical protein